MDESGKVHEGPVPAEHADNLWGVGFVHAAGRDSFFAIRLVHRLEAPAGASPDALAGVRLFHSGAPVISAQPHAYTSRHALRGDPKLAAGVALVQRNAYVCAPCPVDGGAAALEELRARLLSPLVASSAAGVLLSSVVAHASPDRGGLARPGERPADWPAKRKIWDALRDVRDDMLYTVNANVVDMGYIHDVRLQDGEVSVLMTMPHRGRPRHEWLAIPLRRRVAQLPGVRSVAVDLTWEPAWTPNRLSDAGRRTMQLEG
jgi:metal-sulfur cluster biosynthetic enzyme